MTISEILKEFDESLIGWWTEKEIIKEYLRQKMTELLERTKLEKNMPAMNHPSECDNECLNKPHFFYNQAVLDQEEKIKKALA